MKKRWICALAAALLLLLTACGERKEYELTVSVPAGCREAVVYASEEVLPQSSRLEIACGSGQGDIAVVLRPADENASGRPIYLTPGMPAKVSVQKGEGYRLGVCVSAPVKEKLECKVIVRPAEVRIE